MTEVELQKQRQAASNAAQLATIKQSSAYQGDNAALLAGGTAPAQKGQTDFSQWAAALGQQAGGPRVPQDPMNAVGGYDARDGRSPDYAPAQQQQMRDQGFTHDETTGGYWKVNGASPAAAGSGSGAPAGDVGGAPSGGAGDSLSASMASLTGATGAAQPIPERGGSLLRPTLVTRHPAVMSASLAQLGKAY